MVGEKLSHLRYYSTSKMSSCVPKWGNIFKIEPCMIACLDVTSLSKADIKPPCMCVYSYLHAQMYNKVMLPHPHEQKCLSLYMQMSLVSQCGSHLPSDRACRNCVCVCVTPLYWLLRLASKALTVVQLECNNHPLFSPAAWKRVFSVRSVLIELLIQAKHCMKFILLAQCYCILLYFHGPRFSLFLLNVMALCLSLSFS